MNTRGLYAVYDRGGLADDALDRVEAVLAGGAIWLPYRDKRARAPERALLARLRELTRAAGARLIVNDDWRLARAAGADGANAGRVIAAGADLIAIANGVFAAADPAAAARGLAALFSNAG